MRTTRNWKAVKTEFVTGDISNVTEFARMKGIPQDTINKHSSGWLKEQEEHHEEAIKHRGDIHKQYEQEVIKARIETAEKCYQLWGSDFEQPGIDLFLAELNKELNG